MMRVISKSELGRFRNDWLDSHFHFHFAGVMAPMGGKFGPLRVWNDDEIQPGTGFDMHGHRDMEIITYVRKGAISHKDSLGNAGRTGAGDVQVMSAGTGILHAEFNLEPEITELFQIWVEPDRTGLKPRWEMMAFPKADRSGALVPLASGEAGVTGALKIHQDATLYGAYLKAGDAITHALKPGRRAYIVPAAGRIQVDGVEVRTRDGAAVAGQERISIAAIEQAEVLLFDLP